MSAASATAPVRFTNADVQTFLKAIATATETSLMRSANAAETVKRTPMPMAFVMTWMIVLENSTLAAYAMVQVRSSRVDVQAFLKAIATAMATNSMPWAFVAAVAQKTLMRMAFVTMSMPVSANSIHAECATVPVRFTNVDVQTFLKAIATATETNWMRLACAVGTALPTPMRMAPVMT